MTAFTTPFGLFQFRVLPFGLQGAPATFQRMMDIILNDTGDYAAAYLDDVVIHSKSCSGGSRGGSLGSDEPPFGSRDSD